MAKIFFSLAGEGRGHATRVRAVIEELRRDHELFVFAPGVAYELLAAAYRTTPGVSVHPVPGLRFHYRNQRLDYFRSLVCEAPPYLWRLRSRVGRLAELIRKERPHLAITDFEPILPRAAKKCGVPFLSFDHQHFLVVNDLSSLPRRLRWKARILGLAVQIFYRGQVQTIVSSFFSAPLKPRYRNVAQTGVLLRPEILNARPHIGGHLLVYLRRFGRQSLLDALRESGREVRVYGLGQRPSEGCVQYRQVDEFGFLDDLVSSDALVTNGGNQLLGEALWLGKPVLALPETGNFEQAVNAHFLRENGGGNSVPYEDLTGNDLQEFLDDVPKYRAKICREGLCGNRQAIEAILDHLPAPARPRQMASAVNVA
jgi:uncharacterized protein (TIGR00661 family)